MAFRREHAEPRGGCERRGARQVPLADTTILPRRAVARVLAGFGREIQEVRHVARLVEAQAREIDRAAAVARSR